MLDIFTDLFCLVFPLCYTWFILGMPILIGKHVANYGVSNDFDMSKLYDVWEDYFEVDLQRMEDLRKVRRRKSILGLSHNQEVLETQLKHYPNWLRYSFTVLNVGFFHFLLSWPSYNWPHAHRGRPVRTNSPTRCGMDARWSFHFAKIRLSLDAIVAYYSSPTIRSVNFPNRLDNCRRW